jgi:hypothetical protein
MATAEIGNPATGADYERLQEICETHDPDSTEYLAAETEIMGRQRVYGDACNNANPDNPCINQEGNDYHGELYSAV